MFGTAVKLAGTGGTHVQLFGRVKRIRFRNPDTGFAILDIETQHPDVENGIVTVRGASDLQPGNNCECTGSFAHHAKYGLGFEAHAIVPVMPDDSAGLIRYFQSGVVKGISGYVGKKLVEQFGSDTPIMLTNRDTRIMDIQGIKEKTFERITAAWKEHQAVFHIMRELKEYDMGNADAWLIYKHWGDKALTNLKKYPYSMISIRGIGFNKADRVALSMGYEKDSHARIMAGIRHILREAADEGHTRLQWGAVRHKAMELLGVPPEDVSASMKDGLTEGELTAYRHDDEAWVANTRLYQDEERIADRLSDVMLTAPIWDDQNWNMPSDMEYAPSQAKAIAAAVENKVLVMTGGPGVGKTTVTRAILDIWEGQLNAKVLLCAPTGRAAKRLSEATGREAATVHRALGFNAEQGFMYDAMNPLSCDALVIDESSMLDTNLMRAVVNALPNHAALLLIGDADQLPSVGSGNVLHDLIHSERVPVVRLTEIHRQAQGSKIISHSHAINEGKVPDLSSNDGDFVFRKLEREALQSEVIRLVTQEIPDNHGIPPKDIQVLTPMKGYDCGTRELNQRLQEELNPPADDRQEFSYGDIIFRHGDRVMQTANNHKEDVFNGDQGVIVGVDIKDKVLTVQFNGRDKPVEIENTRLGQLIHAYAVTIHKSQGSEYPAVVIPASVQHFIMLNKNLYYTAVTRGKKQVYMVGEPRALSIAVGREGQARHTSLQLHLCSLLDPIDMPATVDTHVKKKFSGQRL